MDILQPTRQMLEQVVCCYLQVPIFRFFTLNFLALNAVLTAPAHPPFRIHVLQRLSPLVCLYEIVERLAHAFSRPTSSSQAPANIKLPSCAQDTSEPRAQGLWSSLSLLFRTTLLMLSLLALVLLSLSSASRPWTLSFATLYVLDALVQHLTPATHVVRARLSEATQTQLDTRVDMIFVSTVHLGVCATVWSLYSPPLTTWLGITLVGLVMLYVAGSGKRMLPELRDPLPPGSWGLANLFSLVFLSLALHHLVVAFAFMNFLSPPPPSTAMFGFAAWESAALVLRDLLVGPHAHLHATLFAAATWLIGAVFYDFQRSVGSLYVNS